MTAKYILHLFLGITLVFTLVSCGENTTGGSPGNTQNTDSQQGENSSKIPNITVEKTSSSGTLLMAQVNGNTLEIDTGAENIQNVVTFDNYIVYDWAGPVGSVKKIYDTSTRQSIAGIPNGKLTESKDFIYACDTNPNTTSSVRIFDIKKQEYFDLFSKLYLENNSTRVSTCEFNDTYKTIAFSTITGSGEKGNFKFKYENGTFNEIK